MSEIHLNLCVQKRENEKNVAHNVIVPVLKVLSIKN
jgi:hypothetical protein